LWKIFFPPLILNDSFAGYCILGLKLFSFTVQNTSLHVLFAFKFSVEKSAVILMGLPLYVIYFFSLVACNIPSVVLTTIICCGEVGVCFGQVYLLSWRLPVPEWASFFEIWEIFCCHFVDYITYPFGLHFSFFSAYDSQVWTFDGFAEFFCIPF
jgi:hypothetical protein